LGLAIWISFSKKVRPGAVMAYAVVEGVFIGTISWFFEALYPGIVMNAVLGTLTTAGAMFTAYSLGWVKVTSRFTKVMTFALIGYAGFALVNLLVGLFTNSAGIYSSEFAWIAGLVGVGLAAFTLNLDFEDISQGAAQGLPREYEWKAAFGLLVTMVWLYLEILRLLAIFNRD
ncbi:MAG: Bax inhibitor-1/YccA family protein, partial [Microbacteriaceae bacterium]|nr:Bax inhibitor-1/YccA family protein [Microbacteriaceae bacterium]